MPSQDSNKPVRSESKDAAMPLLWRVWSNNTLLEAFSNLITSHTYFYSFSLRNHVNAFSYSFIGKEYKKL